MILALQKWACPPQTVYQDLSIPEALNTLVFGPRDAKALAARALADLVYGEVQVLEEVLDEAQGVHVALPSDGRHIFMVLADALSAERFEDAEAIALFLERCTAYDCEFNDEDEWNQQVLKLHALLKESPGFVASLARAKLKQVGACSIFLEKVLDRLASDKTAQMVIVDDLSRSRGFGCACRRPRSACAPKLIFVNTRVQCAVCKEPLHELDTPVRCPGCRCTSYCSKEHLDEDVIRHAAWCFEAI